LGLGAVATILALAHVVHHDSGNLILWLGWLSVTLILGSSLCLFFALSALIRQRKRSRVQIQRGISTDQEYVAQYSSSNRITALLLVGLFGFLTAFLFVRSTSPSIIALSATFFGGTIFYAVHIMATSVRFTQKGFVARLPWFRRLEEPYDCVQRISGRPGTVSVHFIDGRSLKFHSGLGDPDTVIAYLRVRCPESINL
jgi:hypothetical protein